MSPEPETEPMLSRLPASLLLAGAFAGGLALGGCRVTRPNPDHCFHARGDSTCAELDPARPYCAGPGCDEIGDGCVAERPPDGCYSPCGEGALVEDDSSCIELGGESETGSSESETGGDDMGADSCQSHLDCPEDTPYCLMGACRRCDQTPDPGLACFEISAGEAPVCLAGICVECDPADEFACAEDKLLCDARTLACTACTAHDQCPGGAGCDLAMGECLPADAVFHIDGAGGGDFASLAEAMAALGEGSGTLIIHELAQGGYSEGLSLSGDRALAVFGAEGELPFLDGPFLSLEVVDGARVYARGLVLNGDEAVSIVDAYAELDALRIAPVLTNAVRLAGGTLRMRNCMVRSSLEAAPALDVAGVAELDVRYSTLVGMGSVPAVACEGATIQPGSRIRNSVLVNLGDTPALVCASPAYEHNGLEDATGFTGNTTLGDVEPDWFIDLLFADLHLGLGAPVGIADAAEWGEGDPDVDFDGDPRPSVEGSSDFVGADRLP